jgi:hypothetical protein
MRTIFFIVLMSIVFSASIAGMNMLIDSRSEATLKSIEHEFEQKKMADEQQSKKLSDSAE